MQNKIFSMALLWRAVSLSIFALLSGCAELDNLLKPTTVEQTSYKPVCAKSWKGQTIYIDFETSGSYWRYASNLAYEIRDKLIEDVVEDGCFHVQDRKTGTNYVYKVGVRVASPQVSANQQGVISQVSAQFRIKTYDNRDNLVKAMTRDVEYKRPMFVVVSGNSQSKLLSNYASNVSVEIRKLFYASLQDNLKNK